MASHLYEGHLHPVPPFEFEFSRRLVQEHSMADIDATQPHTLALALPWGAAALLITLRSLGKVESPLVLATIRSPYPLTDTEQAQIHASVRFRLGMDEDIQPLYTLGWDDDPFADILDGWYGCHLVKFASPFAAACWGRLQAAASGAPGAALWARLLALGPGQPFGGRIGHAFPTAAHLAAAGPKRLGDRLADDALGCELEQLAREFPEPLASREPAGPPSPHTITTIQSWLKDDTSLAPAAHQQILSRGLGLKGAIVLPPDQILARARLIYGPDLQLEALKKIMARYESWQGYWYHYLGLPGHQAG